MAANADILDPGQIMDKVIKILMLEDSEQDAFLIERTIKKDGLRFTAVRVDNAREFSRAIGEFVPDVIISDHALPDFNSIEALKSCRQLGCQAPFILVTGAVSDEFAVNCMRLGVDDYILKSNLARLPSAIVSALDRRMTEIEKRKREEEIVRLNAELEVRISDRTRELEEAKYFSDSIINSLPGIFYVLDQSLKFIKWNRNFEITFSLNGQIKNLHPLDTVEAGDKDRFMQQIERTFLVGHASSEVTIVTGKNGTAPYLIRSFRTNIGDHRLIFMIGFDVSEQKKTQANLRLTNERLEAAVIQMEANAILLKQSNEEAIRQKGVIEDEKRKSDKLLTTIFPEAVAMELKEKGHTTARRHEVATILFADLVDFTLLSKGLSPEELVAELNWIVVGFDFIVDRNNMERIKTIGDGYMAVAGVPLANVNSPIDAVRCGLQMSEFIERLKRENQKSGKPAWKVRIGIHTGEVIAGVIGKSKFTYDIWGTAVNTASRMESASESGKVNISGVTHDLVKDHFKCTHRGSIVVKNLGDMDMYFVENK